MNIPGEAAGSVYGLPKDQLEQAHRRELIACKNVEAATQRKAYSPSFEPPLRPDSELNLSPTQISEPDYEALLTPVVNGESSKALESDSLGTSFVQ